MQILDSGQNSKANALSSYANFRLVLQSVQERICDNLKKHLQGSELFKPNNSLRILKLLT